MRNQLTFGDSLVPSDFNWEIEKFLSKKQLNEIDRDSATADWIISEKLGIAIKRGCGHTFNRYLSITDVIRCAREQIEYIIYCINRMNVNGNAKNIVFVLRDQAIEFPAQILIRIAITTAIKTGEKNTTTKARIIVPSSSSKDECFVYELVEDKSVMIRCATANHTQLTFPCSFRLDFKHQGVPNTYEGLMLHFVKNAGKQINGFQHQTTGLHAHKNCIRRRNNIKDLLGKGASNFDWKQEDVLKDFADFVEEKHGVKVPQTDKARHMLIVDPTKTIRQLIQAKNLRAATKDAGKNAIRQ